MDKKGKRKLIFSIISIIFFVTLIIISAFTYAYFAPTIYSNNTVNVVGNVATSPIFVANVSANTISLSASTADMLPNEADESIPVSEDSMFINAELENEDSRLFECRYDIYYEDIANEDNKYVPSDNLGNKKEYTLQIDLVDEDDTLISNVYPETQITQSSAPVKIVDNQTIQVANGSLSKKYKITMRLYNLSTVQNIYGKKLSSKINIQNVECSEA